MKPIVQACPEPEFGRKYWRSLGEYSSTPEFRDWLEREFPAGAAGVAEAVGAPYVPVDEALVAVAAGAT